MVAANCLWKALGLWAWFWENYWKTEVEAWISRHVELYYITTCHAVEPGNLAATIDVPFGSCQ